MDAEPGIDRDSLHVDQDATPLPGWRQPAGGGVPSTYGRPQRAADVEAQLLRGDGVHAPDTAIDHGTFGTLTVRAASVRGTYGRYHGSARQDDYAMAASTDGRWLLLAVADGVTNAAAGHFGAPLAARTAVQQARRALMDDDVDAVDLHGVFQSAAYQLRRSAEPMLERDGLSPTADHIAGLLATTLLLAIVPADHSAGTTVRLARVGDSNAWLLDGLGWRPVFPPKQQGEGLASATVAALPRLPDQLDEARVTPLVRDVLVLATDGITDAFGDARDSARDSSVARDLHVAWRPILPPPLEFARQISFRGRSWDDDRTAVAVSGIGSGVPPAADAIDLDQV